MSDDEIRSVISKMKQMRTRFSRQQVFDWEVRIRQLSDEQKEDVKTRLRELWNEV